MKIDLEPIIDRIDFPYWWWKWNIQPKRFLKHRYQRAKRGYSNQDCWDFDSYLARVIVGGIDELLKGSGYPTHINSREEWEAILKEMQEGFGLIADRDWEFDAGFDSPEWEAARAKVNRAKKLLVEYFENLWD